ncbi:hypothetical protein [Burkholderia ubonensis]|uniref:hypothetical protein n=1 Tax=Burkholderia ubonensis TaxID=101571 RepID=UPI0007549133|nr:hypothetical protein [Burkholderia ubonensis]KVT01145.1 hypothetical protein WK47_25055 [Burkholderia ubonensis]KVT07422.1 hypothetical protein WK46_10850 [Burkholderia ubonensis]KVT33801.1 hypothetical protein WK50_02435 [Burkholderia ubonensis]
MKSLQRLQQHILATDRAFGQGISITPRAERLRAAFRRGVVVGATATATLMGAAAYVQVGPGSYDPQKLYLGDATDSRVMASIYDHHRKLLAARERVHDIKLAMIQGEAPESLEEQAEQFRKARAEEQRIAHEFAQQTYGLSTEQIRHIVGDDDTAPDDSEAVTQAIPRFRP